MNCNEVLANRANEILGGKRGEYRPVDPNDHVNMAQSTNDVIPTAIRLAALAQLPALLDALGRLARAFLAKGQAFDGILKSGRTHLQDATPIRLGQEFAAYGGTVERNRDRIAAAAAALRDLGIGGSAVGTGLNVEPEYPRLMVKHLKELTGLELREGQDRVPLMQSLGDAWKGSRRIARCASTGWSGARPSSPRWRRGSATPPRRSSPRKRWRETSRCGSWCATRACSPTRSSTACSTCGP